MTLTMTATVSTAPRDTPPAEATAAGDDLPYRVWFAHALGDAAGVWKCAASFRFLSEAVGYLNDVCGRGVPVLFQSPAGVRPWPPGAE